MVRMGQGGRRSVCHHRCVFVKIKGYLVCKIDLESVSGEQRGESCGRKGKGKGAK